MSAGPPVRPSPVLNPSGRCQDGTGSGSDPLLYSGRVHGQSHSTLLRAAAIPRLHHTRTRRTHPLSLKRALAAAAAMVCGWVAYAVYAETASSQSIDGRVQALSVENDRLRRDIAEQQLEVAAAQTTAWIAEQARKLGYVMPGEHVYVLATPGAAVPATGGVDFGQLPTFVPSASPGASPTPTASTPGTPGPSGTPTPYVFSLPSPSPASH